jgi:hypothetical protein
MLTAAIAVPRMILKIVDMNFSPAGSRERDGCLVIRVRGDRIPFRQIPSRVIDWSLGDRSSEPFARPKNSCAYRKIHALSEKFTPIKKDSFASAAVLYCAPA